MKTLIILTVTILTVILVTKGFHSAIEGKTVTNSAQASQLSQIDQ